MALSKYFLPYMKKMLKPFRPINKRIHEATGKTEMGGAVPSPKEAPKPNPSYRKVGNPFRK